MSSVPKRALLSVHDKTGIADLARGLVEAGWELGSSGGTALVLADEGVPVVEVGEVTGAPEILGGRVKTLHPAIHGGILADRSDPGHLADLEARGIVPIDLVVGNLYPFTSDPGVELIDIGGPTMVRAAAKNHAHVGVVLGSCAHHGRATNVNQLNPGVRRERVEVPNHQVDGHDASGFQVGQMPGIGSVGQDPAVDCWVQRLNPASKNLRGPGDFADLHHGYALVSQNQGRTPAGAQLPARFDQPACQVRDTGLVVDG